MVDRVPDGYSLFRSDLDHMVHEAEGIWSDLAGASILITGGTGFFGMWLVEGLLWADAAQKLGLRVTVLSRDGGRFLAGRGRHLRGDARLTVISGDVTSFTADGPPFTHIIHAATEANDGGAHWAGRHLAAALDGTRRIMEIAAAHGTSAVLLTSSGAVYQHADQRTGGPDVEGPRGLEDYISPHAVYAEAKRMMESLLAAGSDRHGFRAAIARCFAFSGAYLPLDGGLALGNFMGDVLAGRDIVVAGDGTALRSYLHGADLAVWLLSILTRGENGRPYNVGGAEPVSIAELARAVTAVDGRGAGVVIRGTPVKGAVAQAYLPDLARTTGDLGLRVAIGLEESIRRGLDWYRQRPAG